jgi:hypothetical protein
LERIRNEAVAYSRCYRGILLDRLGKTTKTPGQNDRSEQCCPIPIYLIIIIIIVVVVVVVVVVDV